MASKGNQGQSRALSGIQGQSRALSVNQGQSRQIEPDGAYRAQARMLAAPPAPREQPCSRPRSPAHLAQYDASARHISDHQGQSGVIRGHQLAISDHQGQSGVIRGHQLAISDHQGHSGVIRGHQLAISDHQGHSGVIRGHQLACPSLSSRCHSNEGGNQEATTLTCTSLSSRCRSSVANCASTCCEMAVTMEVRVEASVPGRRADALLAPP